MPYLTCSSPLGALTLFEDEGSIVSLDWGAVEGGEETPLLAEAVRQLDAYFDGALKSFDLPLAPTGTVFQKKLWQALQSSHRVLASGGRMGGYSGHEGLDTKTFLLNLEGAL